MKNIAIDFGSTEMRIYIPSKGVFTQPALVAFDKDKSQVVSVGKDASRMLGKMGKSTVFYRPFSTGKIVDLPMAEYMFSSYIKNHGLGKFFVPAVDICVPNNITKLEKEVIVKVLEQSGVRKIEFVDNIKASFLSTQKTKSIMNIHIGFKSGFCAVMADEQLVSSYDVKIGGEDFNKALTEYVRKKHGLAIGPQTAEFAKTEIGGVFPREKLLSCHVKGRNLYTGLPADVIITSDETVEAYSSLMLDIEKSLERCIENVPDELLADIAKHGINLCGGTAKLYGIDKYLEKRFKIPVIITENPKDVLIKGLMNMKFKLDKSKKQ